MTQEIDERIRDLHACDARLGKPCNIRQLGEELIAQLRLNEDVTPNSAPADWQEIAAARHGDTNYDDLVCQLPMCWSGGKDGAGECSEREYAYYALKLAARRLVEPRSKYR